MASKYLALIVVLQIVGSCLGALVLDTDTNFASAGFTTSDTYFATPATLPTTVPQAIRDTPNPGIWHFSEARQGGLLLVDAEISFKTIEITYYSNAPLNVYYQDKAQSEVEVPVTIPASGDETWSMVKFEVPRDEVSAERITFRLVFPDSTPDGYFLLDKLNFTEGATVPDKSTTPGPADGSSTPDNASGAITPTLITVVSLAILKAFL